MVLLDGSCDLYSRSCDGAGDSSASWPGTGCGLLARPLDSRQKRDHIAVPEEGVKNTPVFKQPSYEAALRLVAPKLLSGATIHAENEVRTFAEVGDAINYCRRGDRDKLIKEELCLPLLEAPKFLPCLGVERVLVTAIGSAVKYVLDHERDGIIFGS